MRPRETWRIARPLFTGTIAILLALHAWLAVTATINMGVTADETAHLTGGYSYWRFNDYRLQPENGNLPQRWAALPLLFQRPHLDPTENPELWARSQVWLIGQKFFFESGNSIDYLLLCSRTAMVAWSVLTGLLVFFWSRKLWGNNGALFALFLYALSPTTLAHGPLVTSDMCATFCLLAATGAWWNVLGNVTGRALVLSLVAISAAAVAKFSFVLLLPITAAIALIRVVSPTPLRVGTQQTLNRTRIKAAAIGGLAALHIGAAVLAVWASFGFRYEAFAPDAPEAWRFFVAWDEVLPNNDAIAWMINLARNWRLLPEAYLQGFSYVITASQQRGAFLAGNYSSTGWWWFFPYAFLVKSTLAELLVALGTAIVLIVTALRGALRRGSAVSPSLTPLVVFAGVYGLFSLTSSLNIGQRHILPLYVVLFIVSGILMRNAMGSSRWLIGTFISILVIAESVSIRPHYLAFFNQAAGGPAQGWRHLVDSSLDWGQNSPHLADWLRSNQGENERVYVSLFGSDDPFYHGVRGIELSPYFSFGRRRKWVELEPGLYCISATMLQDVYSPYAGEWTLIHERNYHQLLYLMRSELSMGMRSTDLGEFGWGAERPLWNLDRARFARLCLYLRLRQPDHVVGHSIFIFRMTEGEVNVVVDGSLPELLAAMEAQSSSNYGN